MKVTEPLRRMNLPALSNSVGIALALWDDPAFRTMIHELGLPADYDLEAAILADIGKLETASARGVTADTVVREAVNEMKRLQNIETAAQEVVKVPRNFWSGKLDDVLSDLEIALEEKRAR